MTRTRIELPVATDVSCNALVWACEFLQETPRALWIGPPDSEYEYAISILAMIPDLDVPVLKRSDFTDSEWVLVGDTREVHSTGS